MAIIPRSDTRQRLPKWLKRRLESKTDSSRTNKVLRENKLVTVCEEATCPNRHECYSKNVATFMLMGEICTRTCAFCDVSTGNKFKMKPLNPMSLSGSLKPLVSWGWSLWS